MATTTTTTSTSTTTTGTTTTDLLKTDFSEYVAASPPDDWTEQYDGTDGTPDTVDVSVGYGGKVLNIDGTGVNNYGFSWDDVGTVTNAELLCRFRITDTSNFDFNIFMRASGASGSEDCYWARAIVSSNKIAIGKLNSGSSTELGLYTGEYVNANQYYWMRFRAWGTSLKLKVWSGRPADEPETWHVEVTDSDHSSGWVGVAHTDISVEFDVDFYSVAKGGGVSAEFPDAGMTTTTSTTTTNTTSSTTTTQTFETDFSSYSTGQQPNDWTEDNYPDTGTTTVENSKVGYGGQVLQFDSSGDDTYSISWDDKTGKNVDALFRFRVTNNATYGFYFFVRGAGTILGGDETYVNFRFRPDFDVIECGVYLSGTLKTVINNSASVEINTNEYYWARCRVWGGYIKCKLWQGKPTDEPSAWQLETIDENVLTSGWVAFGHTDNFLDVDVDFLSLGFGSVPAPYPTGGLTTTSTTTTTTSLTTTTTTTTSVTTTSTTTTTVLTTTSTSTTSTTTTVSDDPGTYGTTVNIICC